MSYTGGGSAWHFDFTKPSWKIGNQGRGINHTGIYQHMRQTVVGTITLAGNAKIRIRANGFPEKTLPFPVLLGWNQDQIASAGRAALKADADVKNYFYLGGAEDIIDVWMNEERQHDDYARFTIENDTCTGITNSLTPETVERGFAGKLVQVNARAEGKIGTVGSFAGDSNSTNESINQNPKFIKFDWLSKLENPDPPVKVVPAGDWLWLDAFRRVSTPMSTKTPGLGQTEEGGILEPLTYINGNNFGINQAGEVCYIGSGMSPKCRVDDNRVNSLTVIHIKNSLFFYVLYENENNFVSVTSLGTALYVNSKKDGDDETVFSNSVAGSHAGVVSVGVYGGNNIKVWFGAALKVDEIIDDPPSGTEKGFAISTNGFERPLFWGGQSVGGDDEAPTVPMITEAVSTGANSGHVEWTASTDNIDVDGYQMRLNGGTPFSVGDVLEHNLGSLLPGSEYSVQVRATDGTNYSDWSEAEVFTTDEGTNPNVIVAGAGTAEMNGTYQYNGVVNGKASYIKLTGDPHTITWSGADDQWAIKFNWGGKAYITAGGDFPFQEDGSTYTWVVYSGSSPFPTVIRED